MRNTSRFRLRAHTLKVEAAAWLEDGSRACDQCPGEDEHVQNEVVHFNSKSVSPLQNPFTYDGAVLPEKERFKYLGMLLDRKMNPKIAEEHAVRPYMAAQSRISEFAKSHDLKKQASCDALAV